MLCIMHDSKFVTHFDNKTTIFVVGDIAQYWGNNAASILYYLKSKPNAEVEIIISSRGGDLIQAFIIYDILKSYPGRITAKLTGICASAATVIALACDHIVISEQCVFMIHKVKGGKHGTAEELESMAQGMRAYEGKLIDLYTTRTGQSRETITDWVSLETWFTPEECVTLGFADEVVSNIEIDLDIQLNESEGEPLAASDYMEAKGVAMFNKAHPKAIPFSNFHTKNTKMKNVFASLLAKFTVTTKEGNAVTAEDLEAQFGNDVNTAIKAVFDAELDTIKSSVFDSVKPAVSNTLKAAFDKKVNDQNATIQALQDEIANIKSGGSNTPPGRTNGDSSVPPTGESVKAKGAFDYLVSKVKNNDDDFSEADFENATGVKFAEYIQA